MESLSNIVEQNVPLFSGLRRPNNSGLRSVKPLVPNKIKFVFSPSSQQIIYPGIYFVIPNDLMISDMDTLEKAILKVLREHPSDPEQHKLDIPLALARRLSGQREDSELFNTFLFRNNRLYLRTLNCVWVSPESNLVPTDINCPSYGEVHCLPSTIMMLHNLAAMLSLHLDYKLDNRERVAAKDSSLIASLFPGIDKPKLRIEPLGNISLCLGTTIVRDFETENAVNIVQAFLYSFLNAHTDLSKYMEWK